MTIDEAVKSSQEATVYLGIHHQDRLAKAVQLGIEALKRLRNHRTVDFCSADILLPGETKD